MQAIPLNGRWHVNGKPFQQLNKSERDFLNNFFSAQKHKAKYATE